MDYLPVDWLEFAMNNFWLDKVEVRAKVRRARRSARNPATQKYDRVILPMRLHLVKSGMKETVEPKNQVEGLKGSHLHSLKF